MSHQLLQHAQRARGRGYQLAVPPRHQQLRARLAGLRKGRKRASVRPGRVRGWAGADSARTSTASSPSPRNFHGTLAPKVEDRLPPDVLATRLVEEEKKVPRFADGGPWRAATPTLRQMHEWLYRENKAYAADRLLEERKPLDPALLKSY